MARQCEWGSEKWGYDEPRCYHNAWFSMDYPSSKFKNWFCATHAKKMKESSARVIPGVDLNWKDYR